MCKRNNDNRSSGSVLNLIGFIIMVISAHLYLTTSILKLIDIQQGGIEGQILAWLQFAASVLTTIVVAVLGWRYVRGRRKWLKVLYFVVLVVMLACIVLPMVL